MIFFTTTSMASVVTSDMKTRDELLSVSRRLEDRIQKAASFAQTRLEKSKSLRQQWLYTPFLNEVFKSSRGSMKWEGKELWKICPAFSNVVSEMKARGYDLVDISNPEKSKRTIFSLRRRLPCSKTTDTKTISEVVAYNEDEEFERIQREIETFSLGEEDEEKV